MMIIFVRDGDEVDDYLLFVDNISRYVYVKFNPKLNLCNALT